MKEGIEIFHYHTVATKDSYKQKNGTERHFANSIFGQKRPFLALKWTSKKKNFNPSLKKKLFFSNENLDPCASFEYL